MHAQHPHYHRSQSHTSSITPLSLTPRGARTPISIPATPHLGNTGTHSTMHVKRITLTSKKNWWMVELDEEDQQLKPPAHSFVSSDATMYDDYDTHVDSQPHPPSPPASPPPYNPPRHPGSIFSFPIPATYCAPPNPTSSLAPIANGSVSELFKCIVKKPEIIQLEINDEMQSNANDVATQFLAELRVYTTVPRHRNLPAFLGCLENVGMVLEFVEGPTLYDFIKEKRTLTPAQRKDLHNQLLDALTHLHASGLSHGDLSMLNLHIMPNGTLKLLDFGRSVAADSIYKSPDAEPVDPFAYMTRAPAQVRVEQIHPGTRPFSAPEILRGECQDPRLADAYSFGMVLMCIERCALVDVKPWDQRRDMLPFDFFDGCELFGDRIREYLKPWDERRRLRRDDMFSLAD
ncbi:hypothetical protein EW146_g9570 [Bondarzewia mesenterica]|uniref:Protein kinase domain-containing protein n=1 Tax=Bondarzewia mesenterica TaxID=1095465 RepID=A0A4S4L538_9AGAM|nr:hypothetical protein EW146_g9570 [Bondarzewia mesenterica]